MTNTKRIRFILSLLLICQQPAFAQPMRIDRYVSTRTADQNSGVLNATGTLAPGAVVKVPDEVAQKFENEDEAALNEWLASSGELRDFSIRGAVKRDFFFPVVVVDPAKSVGIRAGDKVYVSIRFLARHQALRFVVEKQAPVVAKIEWDEKTKVFERMKRDLASQLTMVENKNQRNVTNRRSAKRGIVRFDSSCPIKFDDFQPELERVSAEQRIPEELLLSVMHLESGFRCHLGRAEDDASHSVGLFQINTRSSNIPRCSEPQLEVIRVTTNVKGLRDNELRCLENPLVNLEEAARLLRNKYSAVNSRKQPASGSWETMTSGERDSWRLALAAYNGGEAYVYQAFFDIQDYNDRHGTQLDANDWETRRVFFLRRTLDRDTQEAYFSQEMRYKRAFKNILINMAYVESMVGREDAKIPLRPLIAQWSDTGSTSM